ncbi:MAG: carbamoyltransferase HypF [Candidatus Marinarcus sp.]|uniref:carbamoyltransferase HypF n=1 Tax=Candidatus Marinarcus sp. TaxID=3100987 RepID=UPI003AFFAC06
MQNYRVEVKGIVQGVGFRPFVYNLALKLNLKGYVNNDSLGLTVFLQGEKSSIDSFLEELQLHPPVLAKIDKITVYPMTADKTYASFEIIQSTNDVTKTTLISPDIAVCEDCIADIKDSSNFRYNYALTNCTNCGPRYSIIKTVPYDRVNTSMKKFTLCETCQKEYDDPTNRRYHAQPICCPTCGPKITLYDNQNNEISSGIDAINAVAQKLKLGEIVALKGLGGFHLVCDASSNYAVKKLRQRKNRPRKPFALMCKDIQQVEQIAIITQEERAIIASKEKPIVLVAKKEGSVLSSEIAPCINDIGLFLAYTPLHYLLFEYFDKPIVATSANLSDEPIIRKKEEIIKKLGFVVDFILDFDREIINACDDSVVKVVNNQLFKLRNARGYTPASIKLEEKSKKNILALGANQKNTIALCFEDNIVLSPHIGDLNSIEAMEYFERTIESFERFYDFKPDVIVCDKHPNYETTKWAKEQNIPLVQIQHHYAHTLACMAEFHLKQSVLSFAFDGTGYGDDGNIWGGEILLASKKEYVRINHFKNFKLLGGEVAIKQIKRVALSLLFENYTLQELFAIDNATIKAFSNKEIELLHTIWMKELNAPLTSSVGRLFDAVCSFAGIEQNVSYEGESGLLVEQAYDKTIQESYAYEITAEGIDISQAIVQMIEDKKSALICTKFINMLSSIIIDITKQNPDLPVVLTGGVFQNKVLLQRVTSQLNAIKREYYYSKAIPLNDAGISLGQLYSQL